MASVIETVPQKGIVSPAPRAPKRGEGVRWQRLVLGGGFIVLFLLAWEVSGRFGWIDPRFSSSPTRVVNMLMRMLVDPAFWMHVQATATGFVVGWGISVVSALLLGVSMGWYRLLRDTLEPFFSALYAIPRSALMPLLLLWFGFGLAYKAILVGLLAFFPLLLNTISGIRSADATLIRMARSFGADDRQLLWTVAIPGAVPFILTGLRQSAALGLVGVIVGELFSSSSGLGYLISNAAQTFQTDRVFAVIIVLAVVGLMLNESLLRLEARLVRRQPRR